MSAWWLRAACRETDPDIFVTNAGSLSADNIRALQLCDGCPVREPCRDAMRQGSRPVSIIAGGWRWTAEGTPIPHRDDRDLPPPPEPPPAPPLAPDTWSPNRPRGEPYAGLSRFLDAGRELDAGTYVDTVCARYGLSRHRVYAARLVLREVPDLVPALRAGTVTIGDAERAARAARTDRYCTRNSGRAAVQEEMKTGGQ